VFDREGVRFYVISDISRPVSSLTYIIDTAVFRNESDFSVIVEYQLAGEAFPFSSFPS
jgi:hypothetical protein